MRRATTIKDIANALNVSFSTVSKALNDHPAVAKGTVEMVKAKAREMNYIPNEAARVFQSKRPTYFGVIVPDLRDAFFVEAISGMEDSALKNDYKLLLCQSHSDTFKEEDLVQLMLKQRVDGLIITLTSGNVKWAEQFQALGIPVLFFIRVPENDASNYIKSDVYDGSRKITGYLIEKGHSCLAFINGPDELRTSSERLLGFKEALNYHGLPFTSEMVQTTDLSPASNSKAMESLLLNKEKPTAVLAFKDIVALDAIEFIKRSQPHLLKSIDFAGFGNLTPFHYMNYPLVASVDEHPYKLGEMAVNTLIKLLDRNIKTNVQINHECRVHIYHKNR